MEAEKKRALELEAERKRLPRKQGEKTESKNWRMQRCAQL
jgi:hypothetical protein